jgi:hypothetical protein
MQLNVSLPSRARRDVTPAPEERSDDLAGRGAPRGFAARGEGSRDPSTGRAGGTMTKP